MFLTLLKHKLILLVVLFSTPALAQIYGEDSTNDCPDCCKPKVPPICFTIGSGPKQCNYSEFRPVCVGERIHLAEIEDKVERIGKQKEALRKNVDTYNQEIEEMRNELLTLKSQRDAILAAVQPVVSRFAGTQAEECLTATTFWYWNSFYPCPMLCGDSSGGLRQIDYKKHFLEAVAAGVPCGKIGLALYKFTEDPNIKTTVHLSVESLQTFVGVDGLVRGMCKDAGTCANGDWCLLDTIKEGCKKAVAGKALIDFNKIYSFEEVMSCAKINPVSIGIDLAFVGGRFVADVLSCPEVNGMKRLYSSDWLAQARAAAEKIASLMDQKYGEIQAYESARNAVSSQIMQLNSELTRLHNDLQRVAGDYLICVNKALAPTREPDLEFTVDRCR